MLFNIVLMYISVWRVQCKARRNTSRESEVDQNTGDERAYEEMETQLHGQAASEVSRVTAPSSYQELTFK